MSTRYRILCGVPEEECTGGKFQTDQRLGTKKAHTSRKGAFDCRARWLRSQGYEQVGSREFKPPDGGPRLILSKKSKFGGFLRLGKEGRFTPDNRRRGGSLRGLIIAY
jgi:hypothetical protein